MPELPEVETFRRYIEGTSLHRVVREVVVHNRTVLGRTPEKELRKAVEGASFESAQRHGKQLFLELSRGGFLAWHFGMTGEPIFYEDGEEGPRFDRVDFAFEKGHLAFDDPRMLGRLGLVPSVDEFVRAKGLGPDAGTVSRKDFVEIFGRSRGAVKAALMDQHKLAGIGNIYADEVLFQSRIDPRTDLRKLDRSDLEALRRSMRKVLQVAIEEKADYSMFPQDFLLHHRKKGAPCPRCGGRMETVTVGGRTTYFCPRCQKRR